MAGNRRGFIGIFSPQADKLDANSEQELELEKSDQSSKSGDDAETLGTDKNGAAKTESDWDDVFGETPRQRTKTGSIGAMLAGDPALNETDGSKSDLRNAGKSDDSKKAGLDTPFALDKSDDAPQSDQGQNSERDPIIEQPTHPDSADKISPPIQNSDSSTQRTDKLSSATIMNDHPSAKSALSASDRLAINDAIQTLREKLSFARPSASDTPGSTMKLGTTGLDFVDQAMTAVQQNPDTLPRSFDDERFADDVELAKTLRLIGRDLDSLQKIVADTEGKISASTFLGALVVHGTGKIDSDALSRDAYRRGGDGDQSMNDHHSMAMTGDTAVAH